MRIDPKQLKGGTLTGNITLTGSFSLPSLLSETTSLDFLALSSDNSIKKSTLGTMALLSSANFYDKTTANSTFLKLIGGVMSGTLTVNAQVNVGSTLNITGSDLTIRNAARGVGGRALVHDVTNGVTINYANDFTGGVTIGSNVFFSNTAPSYLLNVNFGIGTATPSEKLSVLGNISTTGMFKLNASFGTTGQFIKNTGTLSEWANITPADITGLYLGTKLLMEDTRTSFGNGIYSYRTYNRQTTNNPTGLRFGQILNWGAGASGGQAQVAVGWTPSDNNYIAFRSLRDDADNWYSWKRIYHEGYKPSVSDINGLASYSGLTNYLPLSGGELSGTLIINKTASNSLQAGPGIYFYGGTSYSQLQQGVGRLSFWGYNGSIWKENFSVQNSTGNVGIGTTTDSGYKLDVNGTARFTGNVNFNTHLILNNDRWLYWKDTSGADRRFLALSTNNSFYVGDIDNAISGGENNFFANQQHNFFINGDLKVQLTNGWNYFKGHIQAYGVVNTQVRTDSSDGIAAKMQSVNGNSVYMGSESNHYLNFITNNVIRATIDTAGNFGIGITTPSSLGLQIHKGSISAGITLSNAVNNWSILTGDTTNAFIITDNQWGERFRISANGEVRIGTDIGGYKLNVGGSTKIDGFLALGENLGFNNNQFVHWKDSLGIYRPLIGVNAENLIYLGDIYRSMSNSNLMFFASQSYWFVCGEVNMATITPNGLDIKGNYYQNGVLKTFFDGNYNSLTNRPDLSGYLTWSNVETAWNGSNWNDTNGNPISVKLVKSIFDGKANTIHTHDWSTITGKPTIFDGNYNNLTNRPDLSGYLTWSNVETAWNGSNWNDTNGNPISVKLVKSIFDGKANTIHTHDWSTITGKPNFFDGNYNNLSNLPNLGSYVLTSSIVQDELSVNATNSNAVSAKVLSATKDNIYANMNAGLSGKANTSHTHDWSAISGKPNFFDGNYNNLSNRPDLSAYLTYGNVETGAFSNDRWVISNTKITSVQFLKGIIDNLQVQLDSKASLYHSHDWGSITNKPSWDWSAFVSTILASGGVGNRLVIDSGITGQSGLRFPKMAGMSGYLSVNAIGDVIIVMEHNI